MRSHNWPLWKQQAYPNRPWYNWTRLSPLISPVRQNIELWTGELKYHHPTATAVGWWSRIYQEQFFVCLNVGSGGSLTPKKRKSGQCLALKTPPGPAKRWLNFPFSGSLPLISDLAWQNGCPDRRSGWRSGVRAPIQVCLDKPRLLPVCLAGSSVHRRKQ